jgi:hypothetical protein
MLRISWYEFDCLIRQREFGIDINASSGKQQSLPAAKTEAMDSAVALDDDAKIEAEIWAHMSKVHSAGKRATREKDLAQEQEILDHLQSMIDAAE